MASLAAELTVTQETIRRDLERLDAEGKLIRTHGGAMVVETDRRELPLDVRETVNLEFKRAIARRAVKEIVPGDVIALDASSTAHELAKVIPDIAITVVTNALPIASALIDKSSVRVIIMGGFWIVRACRWSGRLLSSRSSGSTCRSCSSRAGVWTSREGCR